MNSEDLANIMNGYKEKCCDHIDMITDKTIRRHPEAANTLGTFRDIVEEILTEELKEVLK